MGDTDYEKEYLKRKKALKQFHSNLPKQKKNQEIYHKIMGSAEGDAADNSEE